MTCVQRWTSKRRPRAWFEPRSVVEVIERDPVDECPPNGIERPAPIAERFYDWSVLDPDLIPTEQEMGTQ